MQQPFEMSISLDKDYVQNYVKELVSEYARPQLLFWDIDAIVQATSIGRTTLEETVLRDPRLKVIERRRTERGKRIWPVDESSKIIYKIIMEDWE